MKILVTGGGGFLGQALCRGLVERGHEVISLNRGYYPVLRELGVGQVQGDLASRDAVIAAAAGCEAGRHLMQPRGHLGFGIDVEDVQKDIGVGVHHLTLAPVDHIGAGGAKCIGEPTRGQRIQHRTNPLFAHQFYHAHHLGAVILGAKGGS